MNMVCLYIHVCLKMRLCLKMRFCTSFYITWYVFLSFHRLLLLVNNQGNHRVGSVRIRSFSGPHFPVFGRNKDQNYAVNTKGIWWVKLIKCDTGKWNEKCHSAFITRVNLIMIFSSLHNLVDTKTTGFESWKMFDVLFCSWLLNIRQSHKFRSCLLGFRP